MKMPVNQYPHNYISADIMPWISLHFPADCAYKGRVFIGHRKKDTSGIYDLSRRNIDELTQFIPRMHISRRLDYYIMANTVKGVERNTDDIFSLNNIVVDIDCHGENTELSPAELAQAFVWRCQRDKWSIGEMPVPNSVVYTGRGVQLWWAIDAVSVKLEWIYKRIQNWLMDGLQDVLNEYSESLAGLSIDRGASQKIAGWFRLPLTYNTVAKRWGNLQILKNERYSHQELFEMIPEGYRTAVAERKNRDDVQVSPALPCIAEGDIEALKGGSSLMALRVYKISRLRALRDADKGNEMRDLFCLVVYSALLADYDADEAWSRLQAFNRGFKEPLSDAELKNNMMSATRKFGYKLTNQWIIDSLSITEDEQEQIGIYPVTDKIIRFKKSNYARDTLRAALKEERDNRVISLYCDGLSKAEIARVTGISRNTVAKIINDLMADCPAEIETTETELLVAAGAEDFAETDNNEVLKNGAIIYVSYPDSNNLLHNELDKSDKPQSEDGGG